MNFGARTVAATGRVFTRVAVALALSVVLALTSTVSFAAWTASTSKSATASAGSMGLTSVAADGMATIRSLNAHVYSTGSLTATKPITVRNTGSVPFTVNSLGISASGTLPPSLVGLKVWALSGASCSPSSSGPSTTLAATNLSLTSLNVTVPASSTVILCASTTFTGNLGTQAGQSVQTAFAINGLAGSNWTVTDAAATSERTFSQSIYQLAPPTNLGCATTSLWGWYSWATISWTAPASNSPIVRYDVYFDSGATPITSTTGTSIDIGSVASNGDITIRAIAQNGTVSLASAPVTVLDTGGYWGGASCG